MQQPAFQPPPPAAGAASGVLASRLTGAARALAFARALSGRAVILAVAVMGFQAAMPKGSKPSDLIGSFHGATEQAELDTKRPAQVETGRDMATAQALGPVIADSYGVQNELIKGSDALCTAGVLAEKFLGRDQYSDALKQACGQGDRMREEMKRSVIHPAR